MKLFVMRHAQASFGAVSDRERPITQYGTEQTKRLLLEHQDSFLHVNKLWSSDLLRAQQTAQIVSGHINVTAETHTFLSPDGDVKSVLDRLRQLPHDTCLFIVSHQPLVGELVSCLLYGNIHQAQPYATSEVLALELDLFEPGMASLVKQFLPS